MKSVMQRQHDEILATLRWDWTEYVLCGFLTAVAGFVVFCVWMLPWHNLSCRQGHYETTHVTGHTELQPGYVGDKVAMMPVYVPDHDARVWVCDEPSRKGSR